MEGGLFGNIPHGVWNLKFYYYDSERGIPGAIVNNVWKNSQRQWDRNFFVQSTFKKEVSSRYNLMVNAKYARDYMRYLNPDTTLLYLDNKFWQDEIYISVANKYDIMKNWEADLSVDYKSPHHPRGTGKCLHLPAIQGTGIGALHHGQRPCHRTQRRRGDGAPQRMEA